MYHYKSCGLPNVFLQNGYTRRKTNYGEAIAIDNIAELHKSIGLTICETPGKISEDELRFIRKELDMSQKRLADWLDVKEVTYRKWESKNETSCISGPAERLLRALYRESITGDGHIRTMIETLNNLDKKIDPSDMRFEESEGEWKLKIAS